MTTTADAKDFNAGETSQRPSLVQSDSRGERLPVGKILVYAAPSMGQGFMHTLMAIYMLAFATEMLGVAPAVMGFIFLLSRVWDAISDPIAGYMSDRTNTRIGRRRPWLIAGAIPVAAIFTLMWNPPVSLAPGSVQLSLWMGGTIILFYTGMTIFSMPHDALAAELSTRYDERNRIFGFRKVVGGSGSAAIFALLYFLERADDPRALIGNATACVAVFTAVCMLCTGIFIRERPEYQGRGSENPFRVWLEVYRNPHARLLVGVFFLQHIGLGAVNVTAFYYAAYVLRDTSMLATMMGALAVCSIVSVPIWLALGRRYDKITLLNASMWVIGAAFFTLGFLGEGDLVVLCLVASMAGLAAGGLDVLFPSLQSDVIDFDELKSGERKEGVYFAVWHFAQKTAGGIAGALVGVMLSVVGYEADAEQSETAQRGIRLLMSGIPLVTYGSGILLFRRFTLTREVHEEIHRELNERAGRHEPTR